MLDRAFTFADAVWFHVGEQNLRSRRAVEKLGAVQARTVVSDAGVTLVHYLLEREAWYASTSSSGG